MAFSEEVTERLRGLLTMIPGVSEKKMFGGIAFMVNGNMCCGVIGDELIVRLDPDEYDEAIARPHAREFDFSGKPMRGWIYVEAGGFETEKQLGDWVQMGVDFALGLPKK